MRHSWRVFGADDELGTLNKITNETVTHAAREIQTGESIGLVLPLHLPNPPFFGRAPFEHDVFSLGRTGWDDKLDNFALQGSSQWDGFRHVSAREFGLYGGVTAAPLANEPRLGIQHWAKKGIVGRGVLLDVQKFLGVFDPMQETRFTVQDLQKVIEAENVDIRSGDVLCVRFGWASAYKGMSQAERTALAENERQVFSGLIGSEEMAEALWDWGVAAIVCDNPAVESAPGSREIGSLHRRILPLLGMPIGELFDFDALAEACARDNRWSFMFAAAPLPLVGGVGSPANAVAIR